MSPMKTNLIDTIRAIDDTLGEGYARKNPDLIGRIMQANSTALAAEMIQDGLYFLGTEDYDETIVQ